MLGQRALLCTLTQDVTLKYPSKSQTSEHPKELPVLKVSNIDNNSNKNQISAQKPEAS